MDAKTAYMAEARLGFAIKRPESFMCITGITDTRLTEHDRLQVEKFTRYLRDEMDPQERRAYAYGEPMTSTNAETYGMGC